MGSEPIKFHEVHGRNIRLSLDGTEATRVESFNQALCFTNRPLAPEEKLVIKIIESGTSWSGTLRVGVTENDPKTLDQNLPKYVCPDLNMKPGNWGKALDEHYVRLNQEIVIFYKAPGRVMIQDGSNAAEEFITGVSTGRPLYVLFDVYGNTKGIRIFSQAVRTPLPREVAAKPLLKSKHFGNDLLTAASFTNFKSEKVQVSPSLAKSVGHPPSRGHFAITGTVLKPTRSLIVKLDKLYEKKPIRMVLTTEKPEAAYAIGDLDKLCDTTYSLTVESGIPNPGDEVAISISRSGIVYISHNNGSWSEKIHVDGNVDYHVIFDMENLSELSMIGVTTALVPVVADAPPTPMPPQVASNVDCIICLESSRTSLLEPCAHFVLCEKCANSLMKTAKRECPLCRATIKGVKKIYMN